MAVAASLIGTKHLDRAHIVKYIKINVSMKLENALEILEINIIEFNEVPIEHDVRI